MAWYVAPGIERSELSDPLTYDHKLLVFERSVLGWQLEIADALINGHGAAQPIAGSGYAALSILASYHEMIWQATHGEKSKGKSKEAFRHGMGYIFPTVQPEQASWREALDLIYDEVRCGLYHDGKARREVVLSGDFRNPIEVHHDSPKIWINPHLLPGEFTRHFRQFLIRLRTSGADSEHGQQFTRFFDESW